MHRHVHPLCRQHLGADDHHTTAKPRTSGNGRVHHVGQQEVQRPQAHDGEDIGCENDVGVGGDGEDGGMLSTAKTTSVA